MTPEVVIDGILIAALLVLAHGALRARDLLHGVICFIAFGLVMALAWIRLRAPDVALAEAAIGAGVSGALLLDTLGRVGAAPPPAPTRTPRWLLLLLLLVPAAALAPAIRLIGQPTPGLEPAVAAELERSGVSHPVTAVLLNFRGYDTLLEIAVLLLAALGALALGRLRAPAPLAADDAVTAGPIALAMVRIGVPLSVLVAGYLLWAGAHRPGGGFQAAAVLAGGAILVLLSGALRRARLGGWPLRLGLGCGVLIFLLVGVAVMLTGRFLELPPALAGTLILVVESGLTVSVAVALVVLFLGPVRRARRV